MNLFVQWLRFYPRRLFSYKRKQETKNKTPAAGRRMTVCKLSALRVMRRNRRATSMTNTVQNKTDLAPCR